jgi:hypothetical protein
LIIRKAAARVAGDHLLPYPVSLIVTAAVAFITIKSSLDVSSRHSLHRRIVPMFPRFEYSSVAYKLLGKVAAAE